MSRAARKLSHLSLVNRGERPAIELTAQELVTAAGITRVRLGRLLRLGLVEATAPGANTATAATAARVRRMCRLERDLGVNFVGAALILDLVMRLEQLQEELARLRPMR